MTIKATVEPNDNGKYDIRVFDGGNSTLLLFSHQGYENEADAQALVERLWGDTSERVELEVEYRTGATKSLVVREGNP